jgi:hypothetical protein
MIGLLINYAGERYGVKSYLYTAAAWKNYAKRHWIESKDDWNGTWYFLQQFFPGKVAVMEEHECDAVCIAYWQYEKETGRVGIRSCLRGYYPTPAEAA